MSVTPAPTVVVGAPRSGTSLVAQLLASAGVDFGSHLLPASEANPRGFLEDVRATDLDDELMAGAVVGRGRRPVPEQRLAWVGVPDAPIATATTAQRRRMAEVLSGPGRRGLKDPRLVWTLDAWRPVLGPDACFVAVVRRPEEVACSLRRLWERDRPYFGDVELTVAHAFDLWTAANAQLLAHVDAGRWLVVDHRDLLRGEGGGALEALSGFVGAPVDPGAVDRDLHRSHPSDLVVPAAAADVYDRLRDRACADLHRWTCRVA